MPDWHTSLLSLVGLGQSAQLRRETLEVFAQGVLYR